jgi:mRNA-degrading endonuclease toxin of MazEF toxin-antitoxin module
VERGDLFHVDLNPIKGREQAGARYVLVVSPKAFNNLGTPLVCPVAQAGEFARSAGFAVALSGAGTKVQGVVLCNQPRVLDLKARGRFVERVPDFIMDEVLAKLAPLNRIEVDMKKIAAFHYYRASRPTGGASIHCRSSREKRFLGLHCATSSSSV